ncbi:two-component system histidine kinase PnpS [Staphylococcus sp. 11262D007BW]
MIKFYHKLLMILTTITVVSFLLLGFIVHNAIYTISVNHQENELTKQSQQILSLYNSQDESRIQLLANIYKANMMIIDGNDQTKFNSGNNYGIESQNEEILQQLQTDRSAYILNSKDGEYLYGFKSNNITILISGTYTIVYNLQLEFWKYLILICLFFIALIYFSVRYINRTYIQPINEVSYAASLLTEGNYKVRVPESSVKETKDLYVTINVLARRLDYLNKEQKIQRNRLVTTLENIPSAVLMIDKQGIIVLANQTYYEIFNQTENIEQHNYELLLPESIKSLVVKSFKSEQSKHEQIEIYVNSIHQKFFDASCVPILSRHRKQLEGMVIVLHDITKLKKLENLRRDFVANVSHELKTPITSMKGFTETLIDGAKDDPESLDMFLNIILKESNRIQSLVEDLLDLSKIEQTQKIIKEPMNLSEVAQSALSVMQPIAEEKSIQLIDAIEPDTTILAEENKISQVMVNLLSNAIHYSPEHRSVKLSVYTDQHAKVIEVADEGIGMKEEDKYRIFERFYRVDKARSRASGGTGLGLSITKHIVESYGGSIEVESELNVGSTFKVIFPEN